MQAKNNQLRLLIAQMAIYWEDAETNCRKIEENVLKHKNQCDILLLPEMFNSGFQVKADKVAESMEGYTVTWMKKMAQQMNAVVCGSLAIREQGLCFNRLLWVLPEGEISYYDKRHLFAMAGENERYQAGTERKLIQFNGWTILLQVCYDLRFPVWLAQQPSSQPYDLMVLVANWPDPRKFAWTTLLTARAIENQSYVVGLNRVGEDANGLVYAGESQVLDAMGHTVVNLGQNEAFEIITIDRDPLLQIRKALPFLADFDQFNLLSH